MYTLLKTNNILQSVSECECYVQSAAELKYQSLYLKCDSHHLTGNMFTSADHCKL